MQGWGLACPSSRTACKKAWKPTERALRRRILTEGPVRSAFCTLWTPGQGGHTGLIGPWWLVLRHDQVVPGIHHPPLTTSSSLDITPLTAHPGPEFVPVAPFCSSPMTNGHQVLLLLLLTSAVAAGPGSSCMSVSGVRRTFLQACPLSKPRVGWVGSLGGPQWVLGGVWGC